MGEQAVQLFHNGLDIPDGAVGRIQLVKPLLRDIGNDICHRCFAGSRRAVKYHVGDFTPF